MRGREEAGDIDAASIVRVMLSCESSWMAVEESIAKIDSGMKEEERATEGRDGGEL